MLTLALTAPAPAAAPAAELHPQALEWSGDAPPWKERRRRGVPGLRGKGQGLVDLSSWPPEPPSPAEIDASRFGEALKTMCGWLSPRRKRRYTKWILEYGKKFEVDPFLLAAVVYRQSRCNSRYEEAYGVGLTAVNERMHRGHWEGRAYRYHVWRDGAWREERLEMPKHRFSKARLKRAEANIYFAAGLMATHRAQCPHNDGAFDSVPHRHWVSHFYWGDRVRGAGAEDRALEARRRLLHHYQGDRESPLGRFGELKLRAPLGGWPRKVTSAMGADRDEGARRHMGIDFGSSGGEPVYAVAAGRVVLAGVQKRKGTFAMSPEEAMQIRSSQMAPGGRLVMLRHPGDLKSAYMHLQSYVVETGDQVEAGALLGYVGRTGMRRSAAHLHFELRHAGKLIDPMPHLAPYIIAPKATWIGRRVAHEERKQRRRRRRSRRRPAQ